MGTPEQTSIFTSQNDKLDGMMAVEQCLMHTMAVSSPLLLVFSILSGLEALSAILSLVISTQFGKTMTKIACHGAWCLLCDFGQETEELRVE
jgi:hypothetical protein